MRKETIIKYEKEFIAWCKGESVLLGAPTSMHDRNLIWREVKDLDDWKPSDTVYVLNDSYSIYRKALSEGKTVQYNFGNHGINRKDFPDSWKDLDQSIGILADRACLENYRIKPEEPKFKVGDWVRNRINEIGQILQEDYKGKGLYKISNTHALKCEVGTSAKDLTIWAPKKGDWCWFWNETLKTPMLLQFERFCSTGLYKYDANNGRNYQYCEPFLGKLPTKLKETLC